MSEQNSVILNRNIILTFPKPVQKDDFISKIKELANNIIAFLKGNEKKQLGHLKIIATTNGEDYIQVSVLDINENPKIEGFLKKSFEKIKATLNIIVFDVKKEEIDSKLTEELNKLKSFYASIWVSNFKISNYNNYKLIYCSI